MNLFCLAVALVFISAVHCFQRRPLLVTKKIDRVKYTGISSTNGIFVESSSRLLRLKATVVEPDLIDSVGKYPSLRLKDTAGALVEQSGAFPSIDVTGTVIDAVQAMNTYGKGSALVVDRSGSEDKPQIAGIFTERDFMQKVIDLGKDSAEVMIKDVMTPKGSIITATAETLLIDCKQMMFQNNIRHLPIVDAEGQPIGLISMRDIVASMQKADLQRANARFAGDTMTEIEDQFRSEANKLALENQSVAQQDIVRTSFVLAAAAIGAALLQGDWVHTHEYITMLGTFLLGYIGIIFETFLEFNKAGIALLMCTALWVIYAGTAGASGVAITSALGDLSEKVSEVSEVIFFILGAMTIVEIVDSHQGFKVVTDRIKSDNKRSLLRVIAVLTFFMSAILDNLTTTIVIVSLLKKLLPDIDDRKLFGAMVVIAANAGGAWTPIGDVTTTMLWINGQISVLPTMTDLFLPSLVSMAVALLVIERQIPEDAPVPELKAAPVDLAPRGQLVFATGLLGLLSVPVFKGLTGLPPYLGMLASLGVMWSLTDAIHAGAGEEREELMAPAALRKIDTSGVLFFLGILLSVGALDAAGILRGLAEFLDHSLPNETLIATLIGVASALIDNVPLVAATMGMYDVTAKPMDSSLWQLIAYCAGTGGSMLVIGSAAGVALMGLEKVDFVWYAKKITLGATAGYLAGIGLYLAQNAVMSGMAVLPANAVDIHAAVTSILPMF